MFSLIVTVIQISDMCGVFIEDELIFWPGFLIIETKHTERYGYGYG